MSAEDIKNKVKDAEYVFVKCDDNWADEMDIVGFSVFKKPEFDYYIERIDKLSYPLTRGFGTNEDNEYEAADEIYSTLRAKPITKEEYDAFISMFGGETAGDFFEVDDYDLADDEEEEED
jgi:hypothetical protein